MWRWEKNSLMIKKRKKKKEVLRLVIGGRLLQVVIGVVEK